MPLAHGGGEKQHARMRSINNSGFDMGGKVLKSRAIGNGADETDIIIELAHMLGQCVGLKPDIRIFHQDDVIVGLHERRVEIINFRTSGEFGCRL